VPITCSELRFPTCWSWGFIYASLYFHSHYVNNRDIRAVCNDPKVAANNIDLESSIWTAIVGKHGSRSVLLQLVGSFNSLSCCPDHGLDHSFLCRIRAEKSLHDNDFWSSGIYDLQPSVWIPRKDWQPEWLMGIRSLTMCASELNFQSC